MTTLLQETENLIARMSRAEKARVLKWVVSDLDASFSGIECRPGVCGGEPCIVRTRIPVWTLVRARQLGLADADILKAYPTLNAEDLVEAWAYARVNQSEIEKTIDLHESA
jgi:uncharacterized protein (DUF433 family)